MDADVPTDPRHSASRIAAKIDLFDHLVGAGEQRRWHVEAERSGGRQIDDQFELARLHDRQVLRLGALEDADCWCNQR